MVWGELNQWEGGGERGINRKDPKRFHLLKLHLYQIGKEQNIPVVAFRLVLAQIKLANKNQVCLLNAIFIILLVILPVHCTPSCSKRTCWSSFVFIAACTYRIYMYMYMFFDQGQANTHKTVSFTTALCFLIPTGI